MWYLRQPELDETKTLPSMIFAALDYAGGVLFERAATRQRAPRSVSCGLGKLRPFVRREAFSEQRPLHLGPHGALELHEASEEPSVRFSVEEGARPRLDDRRVDVPRHSMLARGRRENLALPRRLERRDAVVADPGPRLCGRGRQGAARVRDDVACAVARIFL